MKHLALLLLVACGGSKTEEGPVVPTPADFLEKWDAAAVPKWTAWQAAEWEVHTHVRENDTTLAEKAAEARAAWESEVGKAEWLSAARDVYAKAEEARTRPKAKADQDTPVASDAEMAAVETVKTLARLNSEASKDVRGRRDREIGVQLRTRDQSLPKLDGVPVPPAELEGRYRAAVDLTERANLWAAVLSGARELKPSYGGMRESLNVASKKIGWDTHHDLVITRYDMKADELTAMLRSIEVALRPLYRQLHTWARYELAQRYGVAVVPAQLPAHWLDDPLAGSWNATFRFLGTDPGAGLSVVGADGVLRQSDGWFTEAGLAELSGEVWQNSSLYPSDPRDRYQKTPGASTWDIDLHKDVRLLMSVTPIEPWFHAANRELAFAHILAEREAAQWPAALRMNDMGAVEAGLAGWADLASSRPQRLVRLGLLDGAQLPEPTLQLLEEALTWVPYTVFAAGTVSSFEREVYQGKLQVDQLNARWWALEAEHQGVIPPETRTERWADPLFLQQLTDSPGRYFEFALSTMVAFQLHAKACADAGIDPRTGDPAGQVFGDLFKAVAAKAGTDDWRRVIEATTGSKPGPEAMAAHFEPLLAWLQEQNTGREVTLPKL